MLQLDTNTLDPPGNVTVEFPLWLMDGGGKGLGGEGDSCFIETRSSQPSRTNPRVATVELFLWVGSRAS